MSFKLYISQATAMAGALNRRRPTAAARFNPRSRQEGFVVDKIATAHASSEYFAFPLRILNPTITPCSLIILSSATHTLGTDSGLKQQKYVYNV
jgi:hypothetical protein